MAAYCAAVIGPTMVLTEVLLTALFHAVFSESVTKRWVASCAMIEAGWLDG